VNTLQKSYEIYNFTLTESSNVAMASAVLDDCGQHLPAMRLIELVVRKLSRKSSNVRLFNFC